MASILKTLRTELLKRVDEIVRRGEDWYGVGTADLSEKGKELQKFINQHYQDSEAQHMAGLCSILTGETIVASGSREWIPGLILVELSDKNSVFFSVGGLTITDEEFDPDDCMDANGELYTFDDHDSWRPATINEVRHFINKASKKTLCLIVDSLKDDTEDDEE